jgi:hypothetical protein
MGRQETADAVLSEARIASGQTQVGRFMHAAAADPQVQLSVLLRDSGYRIGSLQRSGATGAMTIGRRAYGVVAWSWVGQARPAVCPGGGRP